MSKGLVFLVGGVAVAGAVVFFIDMQKPVVSAGMMPEDTSQIEDGAPLAEVVFPEAFSSQALIGQRIFLAKCSVCHGQSAAGQNGIAPPLINDIYRPGHHGEGAFISAALNGVTSHHWNFGNMPPVEGLTPADVKNIVVFIREVQRENGIM